MYISKVSSWTKMDGFFFINIILLMFICQAESTQQGSCRPTSADILGPYYIPNAPRLLHYCSRDEQHDSRNRLFVHGYVFGADCSTPIRRTRVEVWQADHSGNYLNETECRGQLRTDTNGYYEFSTIRPGKYSLEITNFRPRPAHIHLRIKGKRGHKGLVTQMYFSGDTNLGGNDACARCGSGHSDLVVETEMFCEDNGDCIEVARFDIVLQRGRGMVMNN